MKSIATLLFLLMTGTLLTAQNQIILPLEAKPSYRDGVRNRDGTIGEHYWQNYADYRIQVAYNPDTRVVSGSEVITYYNESPDSLKEIVMGLYQEVLSKNTHRYRSIDIDTLKEETVIIEGLELNGKPVDVKEKTSKKGTNLFIELNESIEPESSIKIGVRWHFQYLDGYKIRTGDNGNGVAFIGYFYPKVAVYDDIDGWDTKSYNILHEFYSDFNRYEVEISAPEGYIVSATGRLQNPEAVLMPKYEKRYREALRSPTVYSIIDSNDVKMGNITRKGRQLIWKYEAALAPDFSFSVCKDVLWDGSNVALKSKDVFVDAVYKAESKDFFRVAEVAADAIKFLSEEFPGVDYPYTDMTIVNGWAAMEFAMMVNDPSVSREESLYSLTVHEIGHNYFPFFIGTNERKYAWMDEAWANIFPVFYFERRGMENDYVHYKLDRYYRIAGTEEELPIMTLTSYLEYYPAYRHSTYSKPSYALLCLRDFIGKEAFAKRLKNYFKNWGFRHPIPYDFFGIFNPENDENINWFYQQFYYRTTYADLTIEKDGERFYVVNTGGLPLGFNVIYTYKDGKRRRFSYEPIEWKTRSKIGLEVPRDVIRIEVVNQWHLDVEPAGNVWEE